MEADVARMEASEARNRADAAMMESGVARTEARDAKDDAKAARAIAEDKQNRIVVDDKFLDFNGERLSTKADLLGLNTFRAEKLWLRLDWMLMEDPTHNDAVLMQQLQ